MSSPLILRWAALLVPSTLVLAIWSWRRPSAREAAGAWLASGWSLVSLVPANLVAIEAGAWRFEADGGLFLGVPADLLIGWSLLWGFVPGLLFPRVNLAVVASVLLCVDLCLMPASAPLVQLGPHWVIADLIALGLCAIPGQLLGRWTRDDRKLPWRATLLCGVLAGASMGLLPALLLSLTGGSWNELLVRPAWLNSIGIQVLWIPGVLGLAAVQEFVERGSGTPLPCDPPKRLVVSGPYAYVSNPMQLSKALLLVGWGLLLGSAWVVLAAVMAGIFFVGLAAWDEQQDLSPRYGARWREYRRAVRAWWPRWRPYIPVRARLYVARGCDPCSGLAQWILRARPIGLEIWAAEDHPVRDLDRLTYDPRDGSAEYTGVRASARALEHLNLGWAMVAWTIQLPGIWRAVQLLVDAVGGAPSRTKRGSRSLRDGADQALNTAPATTVKS